MNELPFVTVVIAAYNSERTIEKCLTCLIEQDYPQDKFEVIIVDDGSIDNTAKIIRFFEDRYENIKYIKISSNTGWSNAERVGMNKAKGEFIALTNSDYYVPKNWITGLINNFTYSDIAGVGGGYVHVGDWVNFSLNTFFLEKKTQTNFLGAYNSCFQKKIIDKIGAMDETIMAEDVDLSIRLILAGYKLIHDPTIIVEHDHPLNSFFNLTKKKLLYAKYQIQVFKKHNFPPLFSKKFIIASIFSLLYLITIAILGYICKFPKIITATLFMLPVFSIIIGEIYVCKKLVTEHKKYLKKYNLKIPFIKMVLVRSFSTSMQTFMKFIYYFYYKYIVR